MMPKCSITEAGPEIIFENNLTFLNALNKADYPDYITLEVTHLK